MSKLQNKIDFIALVSVNMANPNGDPLNGNRPRTNSDGHGEMTSECIKRKIRNRMQDLGNAIFVQSDNNAIDDYISLEDRANSVLGKVKDQSIKSKNAYALNACKQWLDVRSFGQVFAYGSADNSTGVSIGVRGPVSIHQAISVSCVDIQSVQITKSVNGKTKDKMGNDRMGMKHFVRFGLYKIKGSINVQLAEKTGFSEEDAETVKECLRTLFVNDASSARPDGSMEVVKLYWWKHNCKDGQYSSAKVHNQLSVKLNEGVTNPSSIEDYTITVNALPDLALEVIDGI